MVRILLVVVVGAGLFLTGAWQLGLLEDFGKSETPGRGPGKSRDEVTLPKDLGKDLYDAKLFKDIPATKRPDKDPTVLYGTMNVIEQEEVSSLVNGRILFIGEEESAVLVAGSAAFLAEPNSVASFFGGQEYVRFYRRIYEGDTIRRNQLLALIEPGEAMGEVLSKIAKVGLAKAEYDASVHGENEGRKRYETAARLKDQTAIGREEFGSAELTYYKLKSERISKFHAIDMAMVEKHQAEIRLRMHEIRALLPYEHSSIKTIVKQRGFAVKQGDPVMVVQNLGKLQAEAQIEAQYLTRLPKEVTATIEPTILEAPLQEFPGHALDVTSVAVSKKMNIVSGSEDRSVCVWTTERLAPLRKFDHDDAVKVVACTPVKADKNICIAGCADGSIYLWDLDKLEALREPIKKAHGDDASVTALAFSPDGSLFASGGSDGSIKLWSTADGELRYAFIPKHGVAQSHEDAVTSLTFTPQCKLISAGRDKTLRVWELKEKGAFADGKIIRDREGNVPNLGVSRDGQWMLFDRGRTLQLLSVNTRKLHNTLNVPANSTPFETLALFSPDGKLILTAGAPEGRMQLWRTPDTEPRAFEVRQFATRERLPVACAAFSPDAGKGGPNSFAVSASGPKIYRWAIPTTDEINQHRVQKVRMTLKTHSLESSTSTGRIGFEVMNEFSQRYPNGRFEAGRPVTIVID